MPFITNDLYNKLVDDKEYEENLRNKYDGYIIARKLYICLPGPISNDVSCSRTLVLWT